MADPILPTACDFHGVGIFYMPQIYDTGQTALLSPLKEGMLRIFSPEKSDSFCRV
jgi:hypothetical protein